MKVKRKIIKIDDDKCNGCGLCIPNCPEGALQVVDTPKGPKVRLVKENFCDGLGACLGNCPTDALKVVEAQVDAYDEKSVIKHIKKNAPEKLVEHIEHLKEHAAELDEETLKAAGIKPEAVKAGDGGRAAHAHGASHKGDSPCGCPSASTMSWDDDKKTGEDRRGSCCSDTDSPSELRQWPVQMKLVNPIAPYFSLPGGTNLVVAADCVPFAYGNFHRDFLKGRTVVIGCPKLDDIEYYVEKLTDIFKGGNIKSVETIIMEVPCCSGLRSAVDEAIRLSGKKIAHITTVVGIKGDLK
ncbi:MAG: 4Fe-4S ferredoxin [Elusimicrobia bacterium HGW-Elusimicrobia-1]|jgi:NAD-dependent dihydropyrimidine dehydrogenase PreA subunit|nr:MAG: 4Fe-4S ferredoxin [Elusimicrobia bacterium HGW-Elusimicrobia-1]